MGRFATLFAAPLALVVATSIASGSCFDVFSDFRSNGSINELAFCVTPADPTPQDEVTLLIRGVFSDSGQRLQSQSFSITDQEITANVLMQDLHSNPDLVFTQVISLGGANFNLGQLSPGVYEVDATMRTTPWPFTEQDGFITRSVPDTFLFEVSAITNNAFEHGDFNNDGVVNAADYTVWRGRRGGRRFGGRQRRRGHRLA